ncbi:uncharacterized protein LOC132737802 [Ruditapes philippinarum]|uniref:uncharacterized protein LOC132737802 n=1 Tax=Ruditapes philippinarum TaxID=129788 RepID=UPI00295BB9E4|nr:uncharacterized protein LOC132737802 [Ruditapes philippinarum]
MSYKCNCTIGYVGNHCDTACSRDVLVKIDQTLLSNYYVPSTRQFLQKLVSKMQIGSNGIYMGVSTFYESGVAFGWGLGWNTNKISLLSSIGHLQHQPMSGLPDIFQPVHSLYIHATGGHDGRYDVPDVALIITGPFKNSQYSSKSESDRINTVMPIVTIGVGNVNTQMLRSIAKDSSHALNVRSVNDLVDNDFVDKVLNILCL